MGDGRNSSDCLQFRKRPTERASLARKIIPQFFARRRMAHFPTTNEHYVSVIASAKNYAPGEIKVATALNRQPDNSRM